MPPSPSEADLLDPGTILAQRYRIEQHIGSGGYANVYRAIDLNLRRERAIKEVFDSDKGVREQFKVESGLLIKSTHPNIPRGYQLFEERGKLYLVMEFVRGRDLEDLLNESLVQRHRPLDEPQVLRLAIEVCGALEETHRRLPAVIHRDIKPANIKITPEGKPVLIDFGLAKVQNAGPTHTAAQGVSPGFAPPEQYMARGHTDARTDVYGMGATLYACLTGKDPPEAPARLLAQTGTAGQNMIPPRDLVKTVVISDTTNALVIRALELSPADRQQTATELRRDLEAALERLQSGGLSSTSARRPAVAPPPSGMSMAPSAAAAAAAAMPKPGKGAAPRPTRQPNLSPGAQPQQPAASALPPFRQPAGNPVASPPPAAASAPGASSWRQGYPLPPFSSAGAASSQATASVTAVVAATRDEAVAALPPLGTSKQKAPGKHQGTLAPSAAGGTAVMGALALAPTLAEPEVAPPVTKTRQSRRNKADAAAVMDASMPPPRSWLNLHGPTLSTMGKVALALSAAEAWWGVFLAALAVIQVVSHGHNRALPFLLTSMAWLGIVLLVCLIGGQVLSRPVRRSGRLGGVRRGFQGAGLIVHAVAVHGVAIWGAIALFEHQLNPGLALTALALFALNVFVGGVFSLANTMS